MRFITRLLLWIICFSVLGCKYNNLPTEDTTDWGYPRKQNIIQVNQGDKIRLVFVGAGVKGVSYFGFAQVLPDTIRHNIVELYGSSIGALPSTLLAFGLRKDEIRDAGNTSVESFNNMIYDKSNVKGVKYKSIVYKQRLLSGESRKKFQDLLKFNIRRAYEANRDRRIKTMLDSQYDITFEDLHYLRTQVSREFKDLTINATNQNTGALVEFNYKKSPQVKILDAISASMALQPFFAPQIINEEIYVDGAYADRYCYYAIKNNKSDAKTIIIKAFSMYDRDMRRLKNYHKPPSLIQSTNLIKQFFLKIHSNVRLRDHQVKIDQVLNAIIRGEVDLIAIPTKKIRATDFYDLKKYKDILIQKGIEGCKKAFGLDADLHVS